MIAERMESPLGSGLKRSRSSPPSPVFDLPPMRFMAMASVVCASRLIEPKDMAPVEKRLTMRLAGSTSSRAIGLRPISAADRMRNRPRMVLQLLGLLVDVAGEGAVLVLRIAAHRMLEVDDRLGRPHMRLAAQPVGIFAADVERVPEHRIRAERIVMAAKRLFGDLGQADAFDLGRGAGEILARRSRWRGRRHRKSARRNRTDRSRCPSWT